ncbi:MAG: Clp protease N-terminal domain-containing protein [Acidobacteriota bacterium]|nr:Clp protease N-terminal domain-containing protein [Acidobacteriota bacterium]
MNTESIAPGTHHVWTIYLQASEEARSRGDRRTGTDHILLALLAYPEVEDLLGVRLGQARQALTSLDRVALGALGLDDCDDAPPLAMREVPTTPRFRDVARADRLRMTPAAKRILQDAVKPNRRKTYVTASQVLAQILELRAPDPAAVVLDALGVDTALARRRVETATPDT